MSERELTPEEIDATVEKTKAEAAQAVAEARKAEAEAKKAEAEALVFLEDARQQRAEADSSEMATKKYAIALAREERARAEELASDEHHHVYRFTGPIDASVVNTCVSKLATWHRMDPTCDITFVFKSPGGSIIDGMNLFDVITELREQGHHVTTMTRGWAASMAGILLQAGDVRVMGREAFVLIHEAAFAAMGKTGDVEDTLELVHRMQDNVLDIFAERAKATGRPKVLSRVALARRWRRKDWWLSAQECWDYGIIDEIR